jgi:hypothetical protein
MFSHFSIQQLLSFSTKVTQMLFGTLVPPVPSEHLIERLTFNPVKLFCGPAV